MSCVWKLQRITTGPSVVELAAFRRIRFQSPWCSGLCEVILSALSQYKPIYSDPRHSAQVHICRAVNHFPILAASSARANLDWQTQCHAINQYRKLYLVATPIVAAEFNLESLDVGRQQKGEQVERRGARPRRAGAVRRWRTQQAGRILQKFRPDGAGKRRQIKWPQDFPRQT